MTPVLDAALEIQQFVQERNWPFCIIGGLAVGRWGRPRATQDVDLTLLTGFGSEDSYITAMLERFESRLSDAGNFARANRVLLLKASNGVSLDVSLGGIGFEVRAIERATPFGFSPAACLVTCSAEDLIVLKAFAARETDWSDIEGILIRQQGRLDWAYIRKQLVPLCELKDAPEIPDRLERLREETEKSR